MKYIVLSFDDGRKDFYVNALPILKKYSLTATLNVIPDLVAESEECDLNNEYRNFMTWDNIINAHHYGVEIANHSADHTNIIDEIIRGDRLIRERLGIGHSIGFSSPKSEIYDGNFHEYESLTGKHGIRYVRSGIKVKRCSGIKKALYLIYKYTKSSAAFRSFNKKNIIPLDKKRQDFKTFPSVTCNYDNSLKQMINLIEKMPDDSAAIFMFHSILFEYNAGYGVQKWVNSVDDFDKLCSYLAKNEAVKVITNAELCDVLNK